ncbi:hypothetical protein [Candidatus Palauibacter sp.]|uniref:hypothetical protein n=1 Tax=Candidatus Palauibacter sp. TaxID=3101350 RepID=UPI003B523210
MQVTAAARDPDEAAKVLEARSGDDQWAVVGQALLEPVSVLVLDEDGQPVWGATVRFEPEAGSGRADSGARVTVSIRRLKVANPLGKPAGTSAPREQ